MGSLEMLSWSLQCDSPGLQLYIGVILSCEHGPSKGMHLMNQLSHCPREPLSCLDNILVYTSIAASVPLQKTDRTECPHYINDRPLEIPRQPLPESSYKY